MVDENLLKSISQNDPSITEIDLSHGKCPITELPKLLAVLPNHTNLKTLDLSHNALGDNGAFLLAKTVGPLCKGGHGLFIKLRGNNIGTKGGWALHQAGGLQSGVGVDDDLLTFESIVREAKERLVAEGIQDLDNFENVDPSFEALRIISKGWQSKLDQLRIFHYALREENVRRVCRRLKIQDWWRKHPEMKDIKIKKPLIITGLFRTGSTLLYNILASDPATRSPKLWEIWEPVPAVRKETYLTDPRIEDARKRMDQIYKMGYEEFKAIHYMAADFPEECVFMMREDYYFTEYLFNLTFPEYREWLEKTDGGGGIEKAYESHEKMLQLLSSEYPPDDHWLLKAPFHLWHLDLLLKHYPDANIVFNHRDPVNTIPSSISLYTRMAEMSWKDYDRNIAIKHIVDYSAAGWNAAMGKISQLEASGKGNQIYHCYYDNLVKDPVAEAEKILQHFGYDLHEDFPAHAKQWLQDNPAGKHGKHNYSLEMFGLQKQDVYNAFQAYYEKYLPGLPQQ